MAGTAAAGAGLRAVARDQLPLALRQRVRRIGSQPARVADAREIRARPVRGRVADRHIAVLVGGDASHPPVQRCVRRVDLLLQRRRRDRSSGHVELCPLRPVGRAGPCRVDHPERLRAADLAVLDFLHHPVAERVERVGRVRLRHARRSRVARLADVGRSAERAATAAVGARGEGAHLEREEAERLADEVVRRPGRRQPGCAGRLEVARDHRERVRPGAGKEADRTGHGLAGVHVALAQRAEAAAVVRGPVEEAVEGEVEAVAPDAELRVVVERIDRDGALVHADVVQEPAAGDRVARLRDGDALVEGARRSGRVGEVSEDPAVGHRVVDHDRVTAAVAVAESSGTGPQRVLGEAGDPCARRLVEDPVGAVDRLDVVGRAYVTVRVRWRAGAALAAGARVRPLQAGEVRDRARHLPERRVRRLRNGVAARMFEALRLLELGLQPRPRRDLGQVADVAVEHLRGDFGERMGDGAPVRGAARATCRRMCCDDCHARREDEERDDQTPTAKPSSQNLHFSLPCASSSAATRPPRPNRLRLTLDISHGRRFLNARLPVTSSAPSPA